MKRTKTKLLIESSLMVALATVLSILKLVEMPYGGSVTMASMLPIVIVSYRCGLGWGLGSGLCFAVIQQLLGLKYLSYFTTWQSVVALVLFDYVIAFAVSGLGGVFKSKRISQKVAFVAGAVLVSLLRYLCHVISGATVWVGLSIPDSAALIYSLGYNATYMIPEAIILAAVGYYIGGLIDFSKENPTRFAPGEEKKTASSAAYALSATAIIVMLTVDVSLLAPFTQNPDTGLFDFGYLKDAPWIAVSVVSAACLVLAALALIFLREKKIKK